MYREIVQSIAQEKCIVILRGIEEKYLPGVMHALYAGGIRLAEIAFDRTGTVSDTDTARQIAWAAEHFAGRMYIGGGTIMNQTQLHLLRDAGGAFAISPHTDPALISMTKEAGLVAIPGAMTITEIVAADRAGADFIKIFPAATLGPSFFRAVHGPLPDVRLLAVNGVTLEEIPLYRQAGAIGFCIGGAIVNRQRAAAQEYDTIRSAAAQYVRACQDPLSETV